MPSHPADVGIQFSVPATQLELSVSEGVGVVRDLVFIEKLGRTEQTLTINLQVVTLDETLRGKLSVMM